MFVNVNVQLCVCKLYVGVYIICAHLKLSVIDVHICINECIYTYVYMYIYLSIYLSIYMGLWMQKLKVEVCYVM